MACRLSNTRVFRLMQCKLFLLSVFILLQGKVKRTKVAPVSHSASKVQPKKADNPLLEKRPKNFGIGTFLSIIGSVKGTAYASHPATLVKFL